MGTWPGDGVDPVEARLPGNRFIDTQTPQQGPRLLMQMGGQLRGMAEDERRVILPVEPWGQRQWLREVVGVTAGEQFDQAQLRQAFLVRGRAMADLCAGGAPGFAVPWGGGDAAPPAAAPVVDGCGMVVERAGELAERGQHRLPGAGLPEFLGEVGADGVAGRGQLAAVERGPVQLDVVGTVAVLQVCSTSISERSSPAGLRALF